LNQVDANAWPFFGRSMRKSWMYVARVEKRPRLGFDRLDEELGSGAKKYSREELIAAREFKNAMGGDDAALIRAVRRYTNHLIEYLRTCNEPAETYLLENYNPRKVDEALLLLDIATANPASEDEQFWLELPPLLLQDWAVRAAFQRGYPVGSIEGFEAFCVPPPKRELTRDDVED
jgi:hypothetical protein